MLKITNHKRVDSDLFAKFHNEPFFGSVTRIQKVSIAIVGEDSGQIGSLRISMKNLRAAVTRCVVVSIGWAVCGWTHIRRVDRKMWTLFVVVTTCDSNVNLNFGEVSGRHIV